MKRDVLEICGLSSVNSFNIPAHVFAKSISLHDRAYLFHPYFHIHAKAIYSYGGSMNLRADSLSPLPAESYNL